MTPKPARRTTEQLPADAAFEAVVSLMALASDCDSRLKEIEAEANAELLKLIDEYKTEYARCQMAYSQAEAAMELHARAHPEWFKVAKSIKTPYGKIAFRTGASLVVKDDEATVMLLRAEESRSRAQRGADGTSQPFVADDYIRTLEVPNLEAMESMTDAELKKYLVKRVVADAFAFTPAKIDFGKAVTENAAAKT